jgi:hypothetical protein
MNAGENKTGWKVNSSGWKEYAQKKSSANDDLMPMSPHIMAVARKPGGLF